MSTDDELIRGLPHRALRWNTPLSEVHADRLLAAMRLEGSPWLLDLGCGWGGLLLRAVGSHPHLAGTGVELEADRVRRARAEALTRGLADRAVFVRGDLREYRGRSDRVICIGAEHAWGGVVPTLTALGRTVNENGLLLLGCGFWSRPPSDHLVDMLGQLPGSLEQLLALVGSAGWDTIRADAADLAEWDEFESTWNRDLEELGAEDPGGPLRRQAQRLAEARRRDYEEGYRGFLGFAYLLLEHRPAAGATTVAPRR